jgi:hypothetical protein
MGKVIQEVLAALLSCVAVSCAEARLLTWTLQDVRFSDTTTAEGFFEYDPNTPPCDDNCKDTVPRFDIGLFDGYGYVVAQYTPEGPGTDIFRSDPAWLVFFGGSYFSGDVFYELVLQFAPGLPPEGGSVLVTGAYGYCYDGDPCNYIGLISGSVAAIPEAGNCVLFGVGVTVLVLWLAQRKAPRTAGLVQASC